MNDAQLLRYARHILLDEIDLAGQERLLASTALVVGCGGLGHAAIAYLAAAGVGRLWLADDDVVEASNLQRQVFFTPADLGQPKAQVLAQRMAAQNPDVEIRPLVQRLDFSSLTRLLAECDVVLDCSDNYATRHAINRASIATQTPLVMGAATRFDGQLSVFDPRRADSPCYACLFGEGHADDGACAVFGVFAPLVGMVGTAQAGEALKVLLGLGQSACGQLLLFNALSSAPQALQLARNPGCGVCAPPRPATV
ncbi:HesA/MoeB/ThiF family protein [Allofranklinella schreckenbergeri]|uniref:HesA/MoeB/ThiF family protein n=1 Tax=Allofranklinella schreckenbergeri TaxID=1076744 RepID=A0A3M6QGL4_9BURK|nr:HesA/MoeB/ThiF family protein [Allofranklinella schreckenbergeri]RMW99665.1 HesA/MoeB/ThiF family protein [Allofranklinella schreckenbergeri]RMX02197.1 HesA/MoeB/ThiF family protein [Allofranklinella schreckenbergeri]